MANHGTVMNKVGHITVTVLLMALWVLSFIGCSSDDQGSIKTISDVTQLMTDKDGALLDIPIVTDGHWTAVLSEGSENWAMLSATEGSGPTNLLLSIDPMDENEDERYATITLTCGHRTQTVDVKQSIALYCSTSADSLMRYSLISASKGLGRGYDPYDKFNRVQSQAINLKTVNRLINECSDLYAGMYTSSRFNGIVEDYKDQRNKEDKDDTLSVVMSINIGFAMFTLEGEGHLSSNEDRFDDTTCLRMGICVPCLAAEASCMEINALYEAALKKKTNGEVMTHADSLCLMLFSVSFTNNINKIQEQFRQGNDITPAVNNLVKKYGVGITSRNMLGGSLAIHLDVDSMRTHEYSVIDSAKLSVDIRSYLFDIQAGAALAMKDSVEQTLRHSKYEYSISGGSVDTRTALREQLSKNNFTGVSAAVNDWMNSIEVSDDAEINNAELLEANVYPLWNFFPFDMKQKVKETVKAVYQGPESIWKNIE